MAATFITVTWPLKWRFVSCHWMVAFEFAGNDGVLLRVCCELSAESRRPALQCFPTFKAQVFAAAIVFFAGPVVRKQVKLAVRVLQPS